MASVKQMIKRVSASTDRLWAPPSGITFLIYHRVGGGTDSDVDLAPVEFDRQLAHLAEHHRVLSLDDAVQQLAPAPVADWAAQPAASTSDEPAVVLTFDDGTDDFGEVVLPALERYDLPATLYVATRFIDDGAPFPWGARPTTWHDLRDAFDTGLITIGSHTHDHLLLDRLDPATLDDDLDRSVELIEDRLGIHPIHFAYPKALPGSAAAEIAVRRRFQTAALAASRVNRPGSTDLHRLWRTPVQRSDGFQHFAHKAAGGHRLEGEIRLAGARLRYRGATR